MIKELKQKKFKKAEEVCDFVNDNGVEVISISRCECGNWHLFYKK